MTYSRVIYFNLPHTAPDSQLPRQLLSCRLYVQRGGVLLTADAVWSGQVCCSCAVCLLVWLRCSLIRRQIKKYGRPLQPLPRPAPASSNSNLQSVGFRHLVPPTWFMSQVVLAWPEPNHSGGIGANGMQTEETSFQFGS